MSNFGETKIDEGLKALAGTMDAGCFACLLALINWGKLWDDITAGNAKEMDGNYARAMMLFISGVGADPYTWAKHGPPTIAVLNNEIMKWSGDAVYRDANKMSWLVFSVGGPALAGSSKGLNFGAEAHRIIAEYFTAGEVPDVPDLTDVVSEFERRRENSENLEAVSELARAGSTAASPGRQPVHGQPAAGGIQQPSNKPLFGVGTNVRRSF